MRLYLDSAPIIYCIERVMPFAAAVDARLTASDTILVSRELARLECLVVPLRVQDASRVGDFDMFFGVRVAELVDFTGAIFRRAAEIRATHNFRTPDALHLAAAVEGGCTVFLTNDAQLTRFTDLAVEIV